MSSSLGLDVELSGPAGSYFVTGKTVVPRLRFVGACACAGHEHPHWLARALAKHHLWTRGVADGSTVAACFQQDQVHVALRVTAVDACMCTYVVVGEFTAAGNASWKTWLACLLNCSLFLK